MNHKRFMLKAYEKRYGQAACNEPDANLSKWEVTSLTHLLFYTLPEISSATSE